VLALAYLLSNDRAVPHPTRRPSITALPDAFRAWRKERELSQEALAAAVGCTTGMIALIETGRRQPSAALLERCATELGVAAGALALIQEAA
jgi:transcriptional regulator with XRE-family HTH domain